MKSLLAEIQRLERKLAAAHDKKTDAEVKKDVLKICNKYDHGTEAFFTALINYWTQYDLTDKQCQVLTDAKTGNFG